MILGLALATPMPFPAQADGGRLRALVTANFGFVWRTLVRLGVPRADAEDALQQVFLVAAQKLDAIEPAHERSFLFSTVLRIASRARRTAKRRREVVGADVSMELDPAPSPEEHVRKQQARAVLDAILDTMPMELRTVFVLFELEQTTMAEIATLLSIPQGTVASRLRRAREQFETQVRRVSAEREKRGER